MPEPIDFSKFLAASVTPAVLISACGLLSVALSGRLTALIQRWRGFHRERWNEEERVCGTEEAKAKQRARLSMLDAQIGLMASRTMLLRRALMAMLSGVCCFLLCSLATGLATVLGGAWVLATVLFVGGICLALAGVLAALFEMRRALEPVQLESRFSKPTL